MTDFEKVLAQAVIDREQKEKAYQDKLAADRKSFNELCQMTDLLDSRHRSSEMNGYYGAHWNHRELKQEVVRRGGVV